jgi:hypothetical protein
MKRVFTSFCLITTLVINAQQDLTLQNMLPPSPEASAFVKYGTYPVGTYTGRPDITVPIYEIKTAKHSVPISLSYDATGIRVNDVAGWVGMHWSLNAGGMVGRVVMGRPDEMTTGTLGVPPRVADIVNNQTYLDYFKDLVEGANGGPRPDGEPDKYYYSFNGRSGSFVFDRNRNVMQIPKTSLKITSRGGDLGFDIVDENGTTYVFINKEKTESFRPYSYGNSPNASTNTQSTTSNYSNVTTAWFISEIISNDGVEHIYFTYENEYNSTKEDLYTETYGDVFDQLPNLNPIPTQHRYVWTGIQRSIFSPRLKTISFTNGKVEFSRISGRQDDVNLSSQLDEITVYSLNGAGGYIKIKSFKLNYGYYYSSMAYGQNSAYPNETRDRYRLRLDNMVLKDAVGTEISRYEFSYNSTELPPKTSCAQDWGGYYNGKTTNTTLVPVTTVYHSSGTPISIGGADRNSDELYMKAGILEKITYPTGGYTIFDLESHKLYKEYSVVGDSYSAYAQGNTSNNLTVQTFTVPTNVTYQSGKLQIIIGPYSSGYPQPFVKIKNMSTSQEETFTSPDMNQWYSYNQSYDFQAGVTYQITSSCYVNQSYAIAQIVASFTKSIYNPHLEPVGGLRIKAVKNYNSDNTLALEENYKYGPNENGGGVFISIDGGVYYYGRALRLFYNGPGVLCASGYGTHGVFTGGHLFDVALVQGSSVVYTDVVKYYGNANQNSGKTTYYYGTETEQKVTTMPLPGGNESANNIGFIIINDAWKKGLLKKRQDYKRDGTDYFLVQEAENIYNTITTNTTYGLIANTKFDRLNAGCAIYNFSDYAYGEYPVNTGYVQLAQTIKKEYKYTTVSSGIVQTTINHTYDNIYEDIEIKTTIVNNKGETVESEKRYPFHKAQLSIPITSAESTALDAMVTKNIIAPVEEIQRNNNAQTLLRKTSFEYVNSVTIAPVNVRYQVKNNPIDTRLLFTKYDGSGNLAEQSKANDITKTYVWGYNKMYPVAEVVGATYLQVMNVLNSSVIDNPSSDVLMRTELNNIRSSFPSAQVITYTYRPHVGITSQTDINGRTSFYFYDAFGRLAFIKDKDGNVIKNYCYNYAGHVQTCTIFGNTSQSGTFTKNNCQSGTGSQVTYSVPANTYFASTQTDANALALNDVNASGQAYANANGTCNQSGVSVSGNNYIGYPYTVKFTNTSTNTDYYMYLSAYGSTSLQIPAGNYTVNFYPTTGGYTYTGFWVNGYSAYGYGATFYNISIAGGSWVEIGN